MVILFQKKSSSEQKAYYSKLVVICFFLQRAEGVPGEGEGGAVGEGGVDESR